MKYTLIVFEEDTMQPFASETFQFDVPETGSLELFLSIYFGEYEHRNCVVIDNYTADFANTADLRFNKIQFKSVSEIVKTQE
jgi:hypothetical protein